MTSNAYSSLWFALFMPLQTEEWTKTEVAFLSRQLALPRFLRVVDLCCGYGRHSLGLAQLGYQVTGLDRDESALAIARHRAAEAGQEINYVLGDMRQMGELTGECDAVINMWQSFSYFDEETNASLLRHIRRYLTPGGRLVIDMYNRDYFELHQGVRLRTINDLSVESTEFLQGSRWHSVLIYRDESGKVGEDHMEWQLFSADEFCSLAAECGFVSPLVCAWADERQAVSSETPRMQIVLEKS